MATISGAEITRHVRSMLDAGPIRDLSDGQLLDLFDGSRADRRELAFAALVERHGPMVRAVARGILGARPDADDAFQATFLVLASKAGDLADRDTVGPWLFQVARRTALAARRAEARRRRLDRTVERPSATDVPDPDLAGIVHEEVARLPDRDRAVVVLCDLEGESLDQAAQVLGCPVGTVKSRLSRARDRLRRRLQLRGLDGSPLVPLGLAPALPTGLVNVATTVAIRFATWSPLATSVAAHLARGVVRTMILQRNLQSIAWMLGTTLVISIGTVVTARDDPQTPPPPQATAPVAISKPTIATVVVEPERKTEVVSEQVELQLPPGVDINVNMKARTILLESARFGQPVRKDQVLFRFDPDPIQKALAYAEESCKTLQSQVTETEEIRETRESALRDLEANADARWREAEATRLKSEQAVVDRAEARAQRYRDASGQAQRVTIDPADPQHLPAVVARLELMDRLDAAEADLAAKRKEFQKVRDAAPTGPTSPEQLVDDARRTIGQLHRDLEAQRQQLNDAEERRKSLTQQIDDCVVRSPTDGILRAVPSASGWRPTIGRAFHGEATIARVVTDVQPRREIGVFGGEKSGLLPIGSTVLFKRFVNRFGQAVISTAVSGTLRKRMGVTSSPPGPSGSNVENELGRTLTLFELDSPIDSFLSDDAQIEFRVDVPTDVVVIPRGALDQSRSRVAVRDSNGTFHWREVVVEHRADQPNLPGDKIAVTKLLALGETIAVDPYAAIGESPPPKLDEPSRPVGVKTP